MNMDFSLSNIAPEPSEGTGEEAARILILGSGPAGLSAALYAARADLKTVILDKSPSAGALAYAEKIENYPGVTGPVSGKQLLDIFRDQATGFGAEYIEEQVTGVMFDADIKEVYGKIKSFFYRSSGKRLTFSQLVPSEQKEDKIFTFIPLLHLANQRDIELQQMQHFGEIEIMLRAKAELDKELKKTS